jgi:uncharacterized protein YyaL (SSP411 family)
MAGSPAPKFPTPHHLMFSSATGIARRSGTLEMVETTLRTMREVR